ncbi:hypothetical protein [Aliterella atlantica]|uniref:8-amino-7-oxononanoate synthase n=1 Tax=Aliterella atlantica CENA595 TaxID=1618023 RepID=A0A0D8ZNL2_9CYAN|nr:hypothetical protein [Aliterella atlantica]KJH70335.1 8-amino-7-oxononanoate synthase [Aliterella atlantica CENA595]
MIPEQKIYRARFLPTEVVRLKQTCFTLGRAFEPGKYIAGQLPDIAFEMGLVEQLPPVRGKNAKIKNIEAPQ